MKLAGSITLPVRPILHNNDQVVGFTLAHRKIVLSEAKIKP